MAYPYEPVFDFWSRQRDPDEPLPSSSSPQVQALIDKGVIKRNTHDFWNETGAGTYAEDVIDWNSPNIGMLPNVGPSGTKVNWIPLAGMDKNNLRDPNLVYDDPNYGPLTIAANIKQKFDWHDLIGPIAMAAITLGAGSIGSAAALAGAAEAGMASELGLTLANSASGVAGASGAATAASVPWYIPAGLSAARQIGSGNPTALGLATSFAPGLQEFGIDPSLASAVGYGLGGLNQYTQMQNYNPQIAQVPQNPTQAPMYNPQAFGDMGMFGDMGGYNTAGSMPAVGDGSQRVASAVAPGAYSNSYNQVVT